MTVREAKQMLARLPAEFDDYAVEFAVRVESVNHGEWIREDHPVSGSFIDRTNRELVLANDEQLRKMEQYAQ